MAALVVRTAQMEDLARVYRVSKDDIVARIPQEKEKMPIENQSQKGKSSPQAYPDPLQDLFAPDDELPDLGDIEIQWIDVGENDPHTPLV